MEVAHASIMCRKTTFAALTRFGWRAALAGTALVACPASVDAQEAVSQDRVTAAVIVPAMSGNETSPAGRIEPVRPLADDSFQSADAVKPSNADTPDPHMLVTPERDTTDHDADTQTFQSINVDSAVIQERNIPGVTKVTTSETPTASRVTDVTLWDEIVPPTPPVPVGATQTTPGSVASSGGK